MNNFRKERLNSIIGDTNICNKDKEKRINDQDNKYKSKRNIKKCKQVN